MKQSMTSSDSCDSVISKDLVSDVYCLDTDSDSDQSDHEHFDRNEPLPHLNHELSCRGKLRRFFIRNYQSRIASNFFDFILKMAICFAYIARVYMDELTEYECRGSPCQEIENSTQTERDLLFEEREINWDVLLWVRRSWHLWAAEVFMATVSLSKSLLLIFLATKGHRLEQMKTKTFMLELFCTLPILATVCYPTLLKDLFVPVFFNAFFVKKSLEKIYNDLHRSRQKFQTISVSSLQQMQLVSVNIASLVFVCICGIQHIQRGSKDGQLTLFDANYFVIVTFSTVGYGDISPDTWLSQLFMMFMICVAFAFIPQQLEGLVSTYMERRRAGGEYTQQQAETHKHVVVCCSKLTQDTLMDFLNEFYAHPKLEDHTVIILCPQELDSSKQVVLKDPKWSHRVIYMKGSSLKDIDLKRCQINLADACFFLASRPSQDKEKADRHTILRSWAVKDFAPNCKQYIQLFSVPNKIHVKFAEHVVCEDEFKFALLANNCLYPGLSTLVSLLVHTSTGLEDMMIPESWQQIYGLHSGNEIYHIQLQKSFFFRQYKGDTFPRASADAHRRFGVALLAVVDGEVASPKLQLNPGPDYRLKALDYCFYMSLTREEYTDISAEALKSKPHRKNHKKAEAIALALQKYQLENEMTEDDTDISVFDTITSLMGNKITRLARSQMSRRDEDILAANTSRKFDILTVPEDQTDSESQSRRQAAGDGGEQSINSMTPLLEAERGESEAVQVRGDVTDGKVESEEAETDVDHRHGAGRVLQYYNDMDQEKLTTGPPPVSLMSNSRRLNCHVMSEPRNVCCLQWGQVCTHCSYKTASDERWHHQLIILASEYPSTGIFNFLVPLRSSFIGVNGLSPIVLLLETEPDSLFLDTIAQFPLVYYMIGCIRRVDDLLVAGINKASHLVVVNRDTDVGEEEILADSETIVTVQTILKLFPNTHVVTELSQASNMRFMEFQAQGASQKSGAERKVKDTMISNLKHIFRQPFAAGHVFSASMLDTLLYQTFVKGYLISFVRLLLGIDAEEGSGHLSSIRVKKATVQKFPEYGELYEGLCSTTGEIPFAIYRTERLVNESQNKGQGQTAFPGETIMEVPDFKQKAHGLKKTFSNISRQKFTAFTRPASADLGGMIRNRLQQLDLTVSDYSDVKIRPNTVAYVITNPTAKRKLRIGDIVYVIQPWLMFAKPSKQSFIQRPAAPNYNLPRPLRVEALSSRVSPPRGGGVGEKKVGRFKLQPVNNNEEAVVAKRVSLLSATQAEEEV